MSQPIVLPSNHKFLASLLDPFIVITVHWPSFHHNVLAFIIHSFIHSFIHAFIYPPFIHSFIHSPIHSFIHSHIHSSIHSFILHSFIHSFILHSFIHSFILPSFRPSFLHSSIHLSSIHSFIHLSSIHSFIHSFILPFHSSFTQTRYCSLISPANISSHAALYLLSDEFMYRCIYRRCIISLIYIDFKIRFHQKLHSSFCVLLIYLGCCIKYMHWYSCSVWNRLSYFRCNVLFFWSHFTIANLL